MNNNDLIMDKKLGIKTTGHINWPRGVNLDYFRTESTSYQDLDLLIKEYNFLNHAKLVDYGSGKGRIIFYINYRLNIDTVGLEVNNIAYLNLLENYNNYHFNYSNQSSKIQIFNRAAEDYKIQNEENTFYFFNPFTISIFITVIQNILNSIQENKRTVDIILYYPSSNYTEYLDLYTDFHHIQTIYTDMYLVNNRECFKIYRYIPKYFK